MDRTEIQNKIRCLILKRDRQKGLIFGKDVDLFYKYCGIVNANIMRLAEQLNPEKYGTRK